MADQIETLKAQIQAMIDGGVPKDIIVAHIRQVVGGRGLAQPPNPQQFEPERIGAEGPGTLAGSQFELEAQQKAAIPTAVGAGAMMGAPLMPAAAGLAGRALTHPAMISGIGAIHGYQHGGFITSPGLLGALEGAIEGGTTGRALQGLGRLRSLGGATEGTAAVLAGPGAGAIRTIAARAPATAQESIAHLAGIRPDAELQAFANSAFRRLVAEIGEAAALRRWGLR